MAQVAIGINRWDFRDPERFVASVVEAERAGVGHAFLPVNPLALWDPYVLMSLAAGPTSTIGFGPLLETPQLRSPAVAAGSIATLAAVSEGRAMLTWGVGDTAVRWLGRRPARVTELEQAVTDSRALLAGDGLDVGATRPARLRHASPTPVWVAASGPRTLRAAGRSADGVFVRVGTHPANIEASLAAIRDGAADVGRDPDEIAVGLIVHTCRSQDPDEIRAITRAMAAGFYEYAPALFDQPGFEWNGPSPDELKQRHGLWPDFHHAADLVTAGGLVDFLPDEVADSFSFAGTAIDVAAQIRDLANRVPEASIVVPHPVPNPAGDAIGEYVAWLAGGGVLVG
ncbi:MAG: LLM class flavin-dependent oxidoreductase [Actinomycetota bacterium]